MDVMEFSTGWLLLLLLSSAFNKSQNVVDYFYSMISAMGKQNLELENVVGILKLNDFDGRYLTLRIEFWT